MSVKEYIGARYIPLFADPIEWDSTTAYEPFTVVKSQGSSYISRQYVPEGIAITNTAYWILWADFNAQIEQYRQEVQRFDDRITANTDAIAAETQARTEAISAEATARAEAIAAETQARETADTEISEVADTAKSTAEALDTATAYRLDSYRNMLGIFPDNAPNKLLQTALSYFRNNAKLYYGDGSYLKQREVDGAFIPATIEGTYDGGVIRFPMSCSSLVISALMGISYENSRMGNGTGSISTSGATATLTGGNNLHYAGVSLIDEQTNGEVATRYGSLEGTLHSWQLAHYLYDLGMLHPLTDFTQLQPGDILFYENWTQETPAHWQNINHCEIFLGLNRSNTGVNLIAICGTSTGDYCQMVARPVTGPFVASLKWFFRPPITGEQLPNLAAGNESIRIVSNAYHATRCNLDSPNAYTVIFNFSDDVNNYLPLHFNVFPMAENGNPITGAPGNFYIGQAPNMIGRNRYSCVVRCTSDAAYGITFQQVENKAVDYSVNIEIYNGIHSI